MSGGNHAAPFVSSQVDEIRREDVFDFHAALRKRGSADRTVANYHMRAASFLRFAGADPKIISPVPRFDETLKMLKEMLE